MSTGKRTSVFARAMSAVAEEANAAPSSPGVRPANAKTAPGAMLGFLAKESEVGRENEKLRKELANWDGAVPAKALDPKSVVPGRWANRIEDSFSGQAFAQLKREIQEAGRNVQPVKVRPLPGSDPQKYELVFGHRRHRACLELGLPVWALIESLDDSATFIEMERENRDRENLSAYEQGLMYQRGVTLFSSLRKLGELIHRDPGNMSKAIAIANLPELVLEAFPSKNDIQFRWATPLSEMQKTAAEQLERRAQAIKSRRLSGEPISATEVFAELTRRDSSASGRTRPIRLDGKEVGTVAISAGRVQLTFNKGVVGQEHLDSLEEAAQTFLRSVVRYNG